MPDTGDERILVAGASGDTGREVLDVAREAGYTVRALTSSPSKVRRLERLGADEVVVGDLFSQEAAERAVEGVDAVLSAVGSTPWQVLVGDEFVDGIGNRNLLAAAEDEGVGQFVMESSLGVDGDGAVDQRETAAPASGESASPGSWLAHSFRVLIAPVIRAKTDAERALRGSPVAHTVFRAPVLTNGGRTRSVVCAAAGSGLWGAISRADVADLMVAALSTPAARNETLEVAGRQYPNGGGERREIEWAFP
jgi:uncharacterized protein YbjT (DUF2867 family)